MYRLIAFKNMEGVIFKTSEAIVNHGGAMEADTISKHGASPKSQMSRGNILTRRFLPFLFVPLIGMCTVNSVHSQTFDCKRDKLDGSALRFTPDPASLTIGQPCEVSVYNRSGKKVSGNAFELTSNNTDVRSNGLSFYVDYQATGNPWTYLDGKLLEIDGNITIAHKSCNLTYDFPFKIRQAFVFENVISCQGEKREFAVAKYKNALNRNLYVVMDISQNQIHLVEAPLIIDGSGVKGADGEDGADGDKGKNGVGILLGGTGTKDGGNGTDGRDGGDGKNGGNGGNITVRASQNTKNQVTVNVDAGQGGNAGQGGRGGQGGKPGSGGREGRSGRDGRNGQYGQHGVKGQFQIIEDNDVKKYFENVRHPFFNIENVEE